MLRGSRKEPVKVSKLKTRLCSYVALPEGCPFGEKCAFAHSVGELRQEELEVKREEPECAACNNSYTKDDKPQQVINTTLMKARSSVEDKIKTEGLSQNPKSGPGTGAVGIGGKTLGRVAISNHEDSWSPSLLCDNLSSIDSARKPHPPFGEEDSLGCFNPHLPFFNINNLNRVNDVDMNNVWGMVPSNPLGETHHYHDSPCFTAHHDDDISEVRIASSSPNLIPPFGLPSSVASNDDGSSFSCSSSFQVKMNEKKKENSDSKPLHSAVNATTHIPTTDSVVHPLQAVKVSWNPSSRPSGRSNAHISVGSSLLQSDTSVTPEFLHALPTPAVLPSYVYLPSFLPSSTDAHTGVVVMQSNGGGTTTSSRTGISEVRKGRRGNLENSESQRAAYQGPSSLPSSAPAEPLVMLSTLHRKSFPESSSHLPPSPFVLPFTVLNPTTSSLTNGGGIPSTSTTKNAAENTGASSSTSYLLQSHYNPTNRAAPRSFHDTTSGTSTLALGDNNPLMLGVPSSDPLNSKGPAWGRHVDKSVNHYPPSPFLPYTAFPVSCPTSSSQESYLQYAGGSVLTNIQTTPSPRISSCTPSPQEFLDERSGYSNLLPPSSHDAFSLPEEPYSYPQDWVSRNSSLTSILPAPAAPGTTMPFGEEVASSAAVLSLSPPTVSASLEAFYSDISGHQGYSYHSAPEAKSEQEYQKKEPNKTSCSAPYSDISYANSKKKRVPPCRFVLGSAIEKLKCKRRLIVSIQHESACCADIADCPIEVSDVEEYPFKPGTVASGKRTT